MSGFLEEQWREEVFVEVYITGAQLGSLTDIWNRQGCGGYPVWRNKSMSFGPSVDHERRFDKYVQEDRLGQYHHHSDRNNKTVTGPVSNQQEVNDMVQ